MFIANLETAVGISSERGCLPCKTKYYEWKGVRIHLVTVGKICWKALLCGHILWGRSAVWRMKPFVFSSLNYNIFETTPFVESEVWNDVWRWGQDWGKRTSGMGRNLGIWEMCEAQQRKEEWDKLWNGTKQGVPLYVLVTISCLYSFTLLFETVLETNKQKSKTKVFNNTLSLCPSEASTFHLVVTTKISLQV